MIADLSSTDAALFGRVVYEYQSSKLGPGPTQREYEELRRLVAQFGGEKVIEAIREARAAGRAPARVSELAARLDLEDPLLRQIMVLHAEEIAPQQPITGRLHALLVSMKDEYPDIGLWREAVSRAVMSGHRNLETVDKLLKRHRTTGSWDPPARTRKTGHGRTTEPKRRPSSRETKYDAEALNRERQVEDPGKWEVPSGLI